MRLPLVLLLLLATLAAARAASPGPSAVAPDAGGPLTPEQARALEEAFVELPWLDDPPEAPPTRFDEAAALAQNESVLRYGEMKLAQGDFESAQIAFEQVGRVTDSNDQREAALAGLARMYRQSGQLVRAAATYERLVLDHAGAVDTPLYLLELGRTLRAIGAPKLAIARFYSVLHAVLKVPAGHAERYLQLARTAQFEIAETHFQVGNFEQAARFFARLNLLDLAPEDRIRAEFKAALARTHAGQQDLAITSYHSFIDRHPGHELSAEARFQLALLLHAAGRRAESLEVTLDLLRRQQHDAASNPERWVYWQRRTGNQLANEFYNQADYGSALTIYSRLAGLGGEPRWRLPILYQMALCQERLRQHGAARELYQQIQSEVADGGASGELADLARMAGWRLEQLEWAGELDQRVEALNLPVAVTNPSASPSS